MQEEIKSVCIWAEKPNGKGEKYIVSCLGDSSAGINIYKIARRYNKSIVGIFRNCPFCGNPVKIKFIEKEDVKHEESGSSK